MRRREVTADEAALWARATRQVRRLGGEAPATPKIPADVATAPAAVLPSSLPSPPTAHPPLARSGPQVAALDRRTSQRLRRGRFTIDASFDLHGHDQSSAHRALLGFLTHARSHGARHVLVVTGRGGPEGGVLRRAVPRWLDEPAFARHVVGHGEAGPRHGGAGALYVVLRRSGAG